MNGPIRPDERITRFARHQSQYRLNGLRVHHTAFWPPPSGRQSVIRTSGLEEQAIWQIADTIVLPKERAEARADLAATSVQEAGLSIVPEPTPHPRHAEIIGWPDNKPEWLDAAKALAAASELVLRPEL